jgi:hypothetical protein
MNESIRERILRLLDVMLLNVGVEDEQTLDQFRAVVLLDREHESDDLLWLELMYRDGEEPA